MPTPNTNPLTYNGYIDQIATLGVYNTQTVNSVMQGADSAFNSIVPQMLNYAELRIQRDLDLLPAQTSLPYSLAAGSNLLQVPVNDFIVLKTVGVGVGTANKPLTPVSKDFIQAVFNDSSVVGPPAFFAMYGGDQPTGGNTYNNVLIGPYTDAIYSILVTGCARLPSLYLQATTANANSGTTFISTYLPDLLIMASMVYISAYQKNFGRMSDDPTMAQSYEGQYQVLKQGAIQEEYMKKFQASAWSAQPSSPVATATR